MSPLVVLYDTWVHSASGSTVVSNQVALVVSPSTQEVKKAQGDMNKRLASSKLEGRAFAGLIEPDVCRNLRPEPRPWKQVPHATHVKCANSTSPMRYSTSMH